MPQFTLNTTIDGSPEEVFRVFCDLEHVADRVSAIKKIEILTDEPSERAGLPVGGAGLPVGVGTRFRETRIMFGKQATEEMEITAMEPGKSFTIGCESCGAVYARTFRFTPNGKGTRVDLHMEVRAVSLFAKIMSPLTALMFGPMMRKCMTKDMEDLKAAVEGRPISGTVSAQ